MIIGMKSNYELNESYECLRINFAAEAANLYEFGLRYSYGFATKLQNSIRNNQYNSCNS